MNYKHYSNRPQALTAEFVHDEYQKLIGRINDAEGAETSDQWLALYADWNSLRAYLSGEGSRCNYAFSRNMSDTELEAAERYFRQEIGPVADSGGSAMLNALLVSRHRDALATRYGSHLVELLELSVATVAPINTELRVKAGDIATRYAKTVASGEVTINGEKLTLAVVASRLTSDDTDVRHAAFTRHRQWYLDHRDELAGYYDELVKLRHQMALNLGHDNFIRLGYMGMGRTDYGPEQVAQFRENVRRYAVPLLKKFYDQQASELGTPTLQPWDSGYDPALTLPPSVAPIDQQLDNAVRVFQQLSPTLAQHFDRMRREELIDLENRKGKRAGAFCTSFPDEPRTAIFCNSTGEADDVRTLMHEMGHAFQKWESWWIDDLTLQRPTADLAEVHSMGMEYLSMPSMNEFFSTDHADKFRRGRWKKAVTLLCYVAVVDEFQHWVYEHPEATPDERDATWNQLSNTYIPGIDYTGMEHYSHARWYAQPHIFGMPFYYIDYAIAETGAMQLAMIAEDDHDHAMQIYMNLCHLGGTESVLNAFSSNNLRSPFDPVVMSELMGYAEREVSEGATMRQ